VFRQAARSRIIVNAHRIHRGEMPQADPGGTGDFFLVRARDPGEVRARLLQVVLERIPRKFGLHPMREVQVLTPMNRGPLGATALNADLRERLNPGSTPCLERGGVSFSRDDKIIQLVNDYDKDVFNGDIGRVASVDPATRTAVLEFEGRKLPYEHHELDDVALAYATTIHKSQGSEYPAVVLVLSSQHHVMLERNLLYTAVTRGRRLVVVIAETKALARAVRTTRAGRRRTALAGRLAGRSNAP
jgi:exodeoxyribonuclease V alpha subunit